MIPFIIYAFYLYTHFFLSFCTALFVEKKEPGFETVLRNKFSNSASANAKKAPPASTLPLNSPSATPGGLVEKKYFDAELKRMEERLKKQFEEQLQAEIRKLRVCVVMHVVSARKAIMRFLLEVLIPFFPLLE